MSQVFNELSKKKNFLNSQAYAIPSIKTSEEPQVQLNKIEGAMNIVLEECNVDVEGVKSKSRKGKYVLARQVVEFLLVTRYDYTLLEAGDYFGLGRDHTTIIHSRNTIRNYCQTDQNFKEWLGKLISKIKRYEFGN